MLLEIILGLMVIIFITESYVIWNLLNKVELLETWVEDFSDRVAGTWEEIQRVKAAYPDRNIVAIQQSGIGKGDAVRAGFERAAESGRLVALSVNLQSNAVHSGFTNCPSKQACWLASVLQPLAKRQRRALQMHNDVSFLRPPRPRAPTRRLTSELKSHFGPIARRHHIASARTNRRAAVPQCYELIV